MNNDEIFKIILLYVNNCRTALKKKYRKKYIDSSLLEVIGPHMDWKNLLFD
jgi:hypothetical protein